ncbi:MAG: serine hydrolase domain-containing protein, partial [Actinomycetota bacterium]|nr:serine hydrolase domain-containing protein [Actinomycetota bacterium]
MGLDAAQIDLVVREQHERQPFSGVVQVRVDGDVVFAEGFGYSNRADAIPNGVSTRFATASGTKTFTGIAVCQLIEAGKLSPNTRLADVVDCSFPRFDPAVTIHHLLTHTSGVPDYFEEEELDAQADFGDVFGDLPVYRVRGPSDLLPLFQNEAMKFNPGQRFSYSNGGYVLLGLAIEAATGSAYADYVERHVFARAGMTASGFFEMDDLPSHTAFGYLDDGRTNIYEVPVKGMPDGGAFVTAPDVSSFWDALFGHRLLGPKMTTALLHPYVAADPGGDDERHYGFGLWMAAKDGAVSRYTSTGADPGVAYVSAHFVPENVELTILGNTESDAWPLFAVLK